MSRVREAAGAVGHGDNDEALVLLWNEVEPARLAGDRRALATIEGLARRIAETGDEAHRREAERLLQLVGGVRAEGPVEAATARIDADVARVGESVETAAGESGQPPEEAAGGFEIGRYVWVLVFLAVVIFNVLRQLGD